MGVSAISSQVRQTIRSLIDQTGPALVSNWLAIVTDAMRLQQGHGGWPDGSTKKNRGLIFDTASDLGNVYKLICARWPLAAAAAAAMVSKASEAPGDAGRLITGSCLCHLVLTSSDDSGSSDDQVNHQLFASLDLTFMALRSLVVASEAASESNLVTVDTLGDLLPAVIASAFEAETEATTTLCALELVQALLKSQVVESWLENGNGEIKVSEEGDAVTGAASHDAWDSLWNTVVASLDRGLTASS